MHVSFCTQAEIVSYGTQADTIRHSVLKTDTGKNASLCYVLPAFFYEAKESDGIFFSLCFKDAIVCIFKLYIYIMVTIVLSSLRAAAAAIILTSSLIFYLHVLLI